MSKNELLLKVLSQKEYRILNLAADRIIPHHAENSPDLAARIDRTLAGVRHEMSGEFKLLLQVFEFAAPLLGGGFKFFTRMGPAEQDRYLCCWQTSPLAFKRMGFQALKRAILAAYYGSKSGGDSVGYQGPWLERGYPHDYEGKGIQHPR